MNVADNQETIQKVTGDEDYPDRPHLTDSRQLNWSRCSQSPAVTNVLSQLVSEVDSQASRKRARKPDDRQRLEATLKAIVLDLLYAAEQPGNPWVAYSRRAEDYATALTRYLSPDITYTAAVEVADFLSANGYTENRPGSFQRTSAYGGQYGSGYRSRLRATSRLVDLFKAHGVGQADILDGESGETIRLKGAPEGKYGRKPLLPYAETDETTRMRQLIKDWSATINKHSITIANVAPADQSSAGDEDEAAEYADPRSGSLYRVFNDGAWSRGGRFYGGWWQNRSKASRSSIMIGGEPTVELDFKSLHPRLIYHLAGMPLGPDVDPYVLGGEFAGVDRAILKVAFNQLLAISGDGPPKKPANAQLPAGMTYKALIQAVEAKHAPVANWFRRGRATELQYLDASIAEQVLAYFTHRGRPVLPVHDSFIVAARDERMLGETMCLAYRAQLKKRSGVGAYPVISGWTSIEIERALHVALEVVP